MISIFNFQFYEPKLKSGSLLRGRNVYVLSPIDLFCGVFGGGAVFLILFIAQGLLLASSIWSDINLLPLERHSNIARVGNCHNFQLSFRSAGHGPTYLEVP